MFSNQIIVVNLKTILLFSALSFCCFAGVLLDRCSGRGYTPSLICSLLQTLLFLFWPCLPKAYCAFVQLLLAADLL